MRHANFCTRVNFLMVESDQFSITQASILNQKSVTYLLGVVINTENLLFLLQVLPLLYFPKIEIVITSLQKVFSKKQKYRNVL